MVKTANEIYRDFETDGVSASGFHRPIKADIREWGTALEGVALKTPQSFGAIGDGVTDDTVAWTAFQAADGAKMIPAGSYLVDGGVNTYDNAVIGNAGFATALTTAQKAKVSVGPWKFGSSKAKIAVANDFIDESEATITVAATIDDSSGGSLATKMAGIYSYIEQTGSNTCFGPKAVCGVSVNAAAGNNDSTGIVGYSYKLDVTNGIGDCAGAGGACHQYSTAEGLALGAEFSVHQHVTGTSASASAHNGNNSMAVHITTASDAARAWAALGIDAAFGLSGGYGFWNGIVFSRSMFAAGAEGMGQTGTVGINFGNNTTTGPEKAIYFGNAEYHAWRSGGAAIRMHGLYLDFENKDGNQPGMRLISPSASFQGGFWGAYKGSTGADGVTSVTTMGALIVDSSNYVMLAAYDTSGTLVSKAGCSPSANAFVPLGTSGSMSLGASSRLWSQVYASSATINTSDERFKTPLEMFSNDVLDAWGEVDFGQFKMLSAVAEKGDSARYHSGIIAQRVIEAFERHGLNAHEYGLLCYDSWEAVPEVRTTERILKKPAVYKQIIVRPAVYDGEILIREAEYGDGELISAEEYDVIEHITEEIPAGDRYGIRYEEALCVEAAYQRRRADRLEARISALEAKLSA